ncbi:DUF4198 domain-containing protein [Xenophilus arseniciresistens]|uniref:DUF4198 domain-containing protein n=1 Tax=Xenophilus arseniciresistens TaxID=1283306 RepID=A0AAE3T023_9BURK|nr:DUF4198 domain-containing protein [Xenophilus arseniciresistens]MDA7417694.1 DUF4198 domain-containing protein [Xenophilus arseniciresistens]
MPARLSHSALVALALSLAFAAPATHAHNVWLTPEADGSYIVQFGGHKGQLEDYPAHKLTSVTAYDARAHPMAVQTQPTPQGVKVRPQGQAALLVAAFDNGYFSKTDTGPMVNKDMTQNPGATSGVRALKFHKSVIQWGYVARMVVGQPFEIISARADHPHAGSPMRVKVLKDGKPIEGVRLSIGENGPPVHTARDGTATVIPVQGRNQLMAILRMPVTGDPKTTSLSYEYLYAFEAHAH